MILPPQPTPTCGEPALAHDGAVVRLWVPLALNAGLSVAASRPGRGPTSVWGQAFAQRPVAPADADEAALLERAWAQGHEVSAVSWFSARGLWWVASVLDAQGGWTAPRDSQARAAPPVSVSGVRALVAQALAGEPRAVRAVQLWGGMLGSLAADVVFAEEATAGVCLGGALLRSLAPVLMDGALQARLAARLACLPAWQGLPQVQLLPDDQAWSGLAAPPPPRPDAMATQERAAPSALLARIQAQRQDLSPAEQRVADHVLAHPRGVVNEPVSDIARMAKVSQPTVIRFCRSLGFDGLSDFKLKLASHLSGAVTLTHSQVRVGDSAPDLSAKVLDNTVAAIVALRDGLNGQAVARAIALLRQARRVEFHGVGNSHIVAVDAQYKFLRFGIAATAHADSALQSMAADLLMPGDVVVAVSRSGAVPELLTAVARAMAAGASVVAITAGDSPLARKATVTLAVDHVEGRTVQLSMVSRILHLLMIDVLAVGLAMQRPDAVPSPFGLRDDNAPLQPWVDWISHAR